MARAGSADLPDGESEIFVVTGMDRKVLICPAVIDCPPLSELTAGPFEQRPTFRAELLFPPGVDRSHTGPELLLVHVIEQHAALGQRLAQAAVECTLVFALQAH